MTSIWEQDNKFKIWLEIEILACEKMAELGYIPDNVPAVLREKGNFESNRVNEIEKEVKHDVIAFLTNVAEHAGEEARFMHQGMTSSDVLDTAFAVQLMQATDLLLDDLDSLLSVIKERAFEHKNTLCMGRSHGIHAEPMSFGHKLASHYAAFERAKKRLEFAREEIATCKISGAVGTYATIDTKVEEYVASKLKLQPETVSTQIIPRDRHAMYFSTLGVIASSIENLATEIRHLQRTEVREVEEYFSKGQKGSSAMPHKRNPILTENLTGLARIVRSAVTPSQENVALWHERDISHSSVERMIAPDATVTLDFALVRLKNVIENMVVYPDQMMENINKLGGVIFSQRVLLALTQAGVSREDSYRLVQKNAMKVWESNGKTTFLEELKQDQEVTKHLNSSALTEIFDFSAYTRNIETVFSRVFGQAETFDRKQA
jgi:adenylosuccinate lyase